ncbi:MAG: DUF2177 family protein [Hyphomicrobium sp.]
MLKILVGFICSALWLLVIDGIWLTNMISVYRQHLGEILHDGVRLVPAILFYLLYLFGIAWFAILPSLENGGWQQAALNGAILGLLAYGTYDLTNQATLKTWPAFITLMDICWGTFLTASAAVVGTLAAQAIPTGTP